MSEEEQLFFRALGIFAGGFTVEAAAAVAMDAAATGIDAIDRLADLVAKSLVVADVSGAKPRFRLLDTTRAYAIEKLDASGERERIARRHAEYYRSLFERAEGESAARPTDEWLADYASGNRQFARGARLGLFARRRWIDRGGADRRGDPPLDASVAARGVPQSRQAGAWRSRSRRPGTRARK